jgi:hypothetical protein
MPSKRCPTPSHRHAVTARNTCEPQKLADVSKSTARTHFCKVTFIPLGATNKTAKCTVAVTVSNISEAAVRIPHTHTHTHTHTQ